jgi:hypothetical protein
VLINPTNPTNSKTTLRDVLVPLHSDYDSLVAPIGLG